MGMFILSRGIQISLKTQSNSRTLLFLPSWASRQCTSASIVRYIPGTYAESEFENTKKLQTSDGCKETVQSFPRARVSSSTGGSVVNGLFSSGLGDASVGRSPIDKLSDSELMFNETTYADVDYEEINPETTDGRINQIVENKAIKLLAARALSAFALRKKLMSDKFPPRIIDSVLVDLKDRGLLNDSLYAESFSRSRWLSLSWGPRKIKRALLEKGISLENASKAACQVFEDEDSIEDRQEMHLGMSSSNLNRLFGQALKQWLRDRDKKPENRKSGMVRWLQYRGFDWAVTKYILRKLELEHPL